MDETTTTMLMTTTSLESDILSSDVCCLIRLQFTELAARSNLQS